MPELRYIGRSEDEIAKARESDKIDAHARRLTTAKILIGSWAIGSTVFGLGVCLGVRTGEAPQPGITDRGCTVVFEEGDSREELMDRTGTNVVELRELNSSKPAVDIERLKPGDHVTLDSCDRLDEDREIVPQT